MTIRFNWKSRGRERNCLYYLFITPSSLPRGTWRVPRTIVDFLKYNTLPGFLKKLIGSTQTIYFNWLMILIYQVLRHFTIWQWDEQFHSNTISSICIYYPKKSRKSGLHTSKRTIHFNTSHYERCVTENV